jgi:hypothetical protein
MSLDNFLLSLAYLQSALVVVFGAMMIRAHFRDRRAWLRARRATPVPARVVGSKRSEVDVPSAREKSQFEVETHYDVPRVGVLVHRALFPTEGKAILHARIHKEGSVHPVVPNPVERGQVFLAADLRKAKWHLAPLGALVIAVGVFLAWRVYVDPW